MVGGQGTQLREDEPHRQVLDHSQAVCMHLTPLSSDDVPAKESDTTVIEPELGDNRVLVDGVYSLYLTVEDLSFIYFNVNIIIILL